MRILTMLVLVIALAAAAIFVFAHLRDRAPAPSGAVQASACTRSAAHDVSVAGAPYKVTAAAEGAPCSAAQLTLSVRDGAGAVLWRYQALYLDLAFGGAGAEAPPDVSAAEMDSFLAGWTDVTVSHAAALPDWPASAARLAAVEDAGLVTDTPLARSAYESLRGADAPTVCYAATMEVSHCIAFDAATHKAKLIAAFGPRGVDLRMAP
jgi:hypothetical protein